MSPGIERSDLPDLREFLDNLPKKPCPSKLPEEYCKLCRRLNGEVAHYCETRELPPRPMEETLEEMREYEEEFEEPRITHKVPILERPRYEEGETSLEFAPSEKVIQEARKSLPRFIPVHRGPRPFRPLEEFGTEEFETFTLEKPSIFKSPSAIAEGEEGMMFSLVSDEGVIEVTPLDVDSEGSVPSETIFESPEGVVEVVEISEEEEETPFFQFIEEGEGEIVEAEIVEAEIVEEGEMLEEYVPKEVEAETEEGISDMTQKVSEMAEPPEKRYYEGEVPERGPTFIPQPIAEEIKLEPKEKKKKKLFGKKRPKIKKKVKMKKLREKEEEAEIQEELEPVLKEPPEEELLAKDELESVKEEKPYEEMKALAELLGKEIEEEPLEEISEETKPSEEMKTLTELLGEPLEEERGEEISEEVQEPEMKEEEGPSEEIKYEPEIEEKEPEEEPLEPQPDEEITSLEKIKPEPEMEEEEPEKELEKEDLEEKLEPESSEEMMPSEDIITESEIEEQKPEKELKEQFPTQIEKKIEEIAGPVLSEVTRVCPKCGEETSFIDQYKMYYCYSCNEYVEPLEKSIEAGLEPKFGEEVKPSEELRFHPEKEEKAIEEVPKEELPIGTEERTEKVEQQIPTDLTNVCPKCGGEPTYIEQYKRYYCYTCSEYMEPSMVPEEPTKKKGKKKKKKFRMKKIKIRKSSKQEDENDFIDDTKETDQ
jgi:ribosomal protein S27AE